MSSSKKQPITKVNGSGAEASEQMEAPKIEFPCEDYPIKAIGVNDPGFQEMVIDIVRQFAPDIDASAVVSIPSREGTFASVRFKICATGPDQLEQIHKALKATGKVKMVL